ncbi:hypothetical protein E4U30_000020 [Claviceps sp. LM220 group G6]|nr:hypothetical protein E4U30_000020 [Claviceps sp. LM220 group G6]
MGRSLHARFKRWDGIEPDTNGEMQKVGSGQQDAQGEWGFFWPRTSRKSSRTRWPASCHSGRDLKSIRRPSSHVVWKQSFLFLYHTIQPDYSHFNILPRTIFLRKQTPFPPYQNVSLVRLDTAIALAAHLAPAPAAAINAPARAAPMREPPPSARHWEATTGRTSTGPSRSDEGPCNPTVNSSQVFVICHISGLGGWEWLFCAVGTLECKELGL